MTSQPSTFREGRALLSFEAESVNCPNLPISHPPHGLSLGSVAGSVSYGARSVSYGVRSVSYGVRSASVSSAGARALQESPAQMLSSRERMRPGQDSPEHQRGQ